MFFTFSASFALRSAREANDRWKTLTSSGASPDAARQAFSTTSSPGKGCAHVLAKVSVQNLAVSRNCALLFMYCSATTASCEAAGHGRWMIREGRRSPLSQCVQVQLSVLACGSDGSGDAKRA